MFRGEEKWYISKSVWNITYTVLSELKIFGTMELKHILTQVFTRIKTTNITVHKFNNYGFLVLVDYILYFMLYIYLHLFGALVSLYFHQADGSRIKTWSIKMSVGTTLVYLLLCLSPFALSSFSLWILLHRGENK